MNEIDRLFKRLPKKYHERVGNFIPQKINTEKIKYNYMLYLGYDWSWGNINSTPVKNITEAIVFIKGATKKYKIMY